MTDRPSEAPNSRAGAAPILPLTPDGAWCEIRRAPRDRRCRPALFLDRDGVLVEDVGYLARPGDVTLIAGAGAAIAKAGRAGWVVVMVTNQSGVGRGYYTWHDFAAVQGRIVDELAALGAEFDMVLACGHHPEAADPAYRHPAHPWRKPAPGMILEAAARLNIDRGRSWIIGDHATDLEAGRAAGLAGGVHVLTGRGAAERAAILAGREEPGFTRLLADHLAQALDRLEGMTAGPTRRGP